MSNKIIGLFTLRTQYIMLTHAAYASVSRIHDIACDEIIYVYRGDESSDDRPYRMTIIDERGGFVYFEDAQGNERSISIDEPIFAYRKKTVYDRMKPDTQIDELEEFALKFPEGSLLRDFIHYNLIQWLRRNKDNPDIWQELVTTKNDLHRCIDRITRLENESKADVQ